PQAAHPAQGAGHAVLDHPGSLRPGAHPTRLDAGLRARGDRRAARRPGGHREHAHQRGSRAVRPLDDPEALPRGPITRVIASPIPLAVLGDPLTYARSPDLHRAGLAAVGRAGVSEAIRTPAAELGARLEELAARGVLGVNLTHPLKQPVLTHLARVSV